MHMVTRERHMNQSKTNLETRTKKPNINNPKRLHIPFA
jgi:hypothetical protein